LVKILYTKWDRDLNLWKNKLRHLKWVSEYRIDIIKNNFSLEGKEILDIGSGPQFLSDLLREKGAKVTTLDKFAPADICMDVNDDFINVIKDKKYDMIIMGAVVRYIKNIKCFLEKASLCLKDDGYIFIDEFVHNFFNDVFLEFMVSIGAMEQWPKEKFVSIDKLEKIISKIKDFKIEKIYSCWPLFYLEGKWFEPVWYTLILKKNKRL